MDPRLAFDREYLPEGGALIGVDEAGRGPLAGPVVAAAVRIEAEALDSFAASAAKFDDSKQLSEEQREEAYALLVEWHAGDRLKLAWAREEVDSIEEHNILGATTLAMATVIDSVSDAERGERVLVDGRPVKGLEREHEGIVKGDGKSLVIGMASIVAKVVRDRIMRELAEHYPEYGFALHKGYGTKLHRTAILRHGPCPQHRPTFLRKLLSEDA